MCWRCRGHLPGTWPTIAGVQGAWWPTIGPDMILKGSQQSKPRWWTLRIMFTRRLTVKHGKRGRRYKATQCRVPRLSGLLTAPRAVPTAASANPDNRTAGAGVNAASDVHSASGTHGGGGGNEGENGGENGGDNGGKNGGKNGGEGEDGDESEDGGGGRSGYEPDATIARMWTRKDRSKWTEELGRAFSAFERLKQFGGVEWAVCVAKLFDFEKKCGFSEETLITTEERPDIMKRWLGRARKWEVKQQLGDLGAEAIEGTFIDGWWKWWNVIQPKERGAMLRPAGLDWGAVTKLHGRNGLLQVMATLLWWGETTETMTPIDRMTWTLAVEDVTWALEQMLMPGVIARGKE
ncbi:hypothetical protein R3P38DRAFT_2779769 [Favolaschia claudopus]|uniref:Uncharacterized protein n=1 Tax=Favolaschia claudopus TaxID=2862362 RepID=A0AAW0BAQ8_9AGAR